jgi:hypothetical protein
MAESLISVERLAEKDAAIKAVVKDPCGDFVDPRTRRAVLYSELFADENAMERVGFPGLPKEVRFYNRYYWISIAARFHQDKVGHDAGVEQQVYKVLETAPPMVDWRVVEELHEQVKQTVLEKVAQSFRGNA